MAAKVIPIPPGFHTLTPHLTVRNASEALEFYKNAFGAEVLHVANMPDGRVMHASVRMGDSILMLNDEMPEHGALSPLSSGGSGVTLHIYTQNVDDAFARAVAAGATVKMPVADQFWGDRYGVVADPYGFQWSLATRVKELSPDEVQEEQEKLFPAMKKTA
jgi:uncharacterized glyoxalase superfamily protein PhnB